MACDNPPLDNDADSLLLSPDALQVLLDHIAPGSRLKAQHSLAGSYSNLTHLVEGRNRDGTLLRFVVRRYVYGHRAEKARVEYNALRFL
jgi:hypothetical protein